MRDTTDDSTTATEPVPVRATPAHDLGRRIDATERAIARRGRSTRDPRAIGTDPTTNTRRAAEPNRPE